MQSRWRRQPERVSNSLSNIFMGNNIEDTTLTTFWCLPCSPFQFFETQGAFAFQPSRCSVGSRLIYGGFLAYGKGITLSPTVSVFMRTHCCLLSSRREPAHIDVRLYSVLNSLHNCNRVAIMAHAGGTTSIGRRAMPESQPSLPRSLPLE